MGKHVEILLDKFEILDTSWKTVEILLVIVGAPHAQCIRHEKMVWQGEITVISIDDGVYWCNEYKREVKFFQE